MNFEVKNKNGTKVINYRLSTNIESYDMLDVDY